MNNVLDPAATSPTNEQWQARKVSAIARGQGNAQKFYVAKAKNAEMWDVEGNRYIDLGAGIAVVNTGHSHPKVVEAAKAQMDEFSHTCVMVSPYGVAVQLAERLNELAPGNSEKRSMFVSTGAEAVENAIKIARAHTGRRGVIAFHGGFHGRTHYTLGLTGKVNPYKAGFGPFPAEIHHVPYPVPFHGISEAQSIDAIKMLFKCDLPASAVAAIILEPVQGEGGFYQASPAFLKQLRALCDEHGILLICDEIQTGFARTGKLFATEYADIEPDMMTLAKGLAGGFPLAAVVGKAEVMDAPGPGALGGTYGGSPVGCAAALAVLDVIESENLCQRSIDVGNKIVARLEKIQQKYSSVLGEIRSTGAMVAAEFVHNGDADQPNKDMPKQLVAKASEKGLVLLSCGIRSNVIRFLPPLTIEDDVLNEGLDILEQCMDELCA